MKTLSLQKHAAAPTLLALGLSLLVLTGCATQQPTARGPAPEPLRPAARDDRPSAQPESAQPESAPASAYQLDGNGLYRLLLGEVAILRQQPEAALALLGAAHTQYPDDTWILSRLAPLSAQHGALDNALTYYRAWAELAPANTDALHGVWQLALARQQPEVAWQALAALKRQMPEFHAYTPLHFLADWSPEQRTRFRGNILNSDIPAANSPDMQLLLGYLADSDNTARTHWRNLARLLDTPQAYRHYDRLLEDAERPDARIILMTAATNRYPDQVALYLSGAQAHLTTGDIPGARDFLQSGLDHQPEQPDLLRFAGELTFRQEPDSAQSYFEQLIGSREDATAHYYLGRIAAENSRPEEAFFHYDQVSAGEWLAKALQQQLTLIRDQELPQMNADRLFAQQLDAHPDAIVTISNLHGRYWYDAGHYAKAYARFSYGLQAQPDNLDLLYMRALSAEPLSRLEDLEADLRRILTRDPDNTAALNALGYTLVDRTDRVNEAAELIEQAYNQEPDNTAIIDSMGWLRFHQGLYDDAVAFLQLGMKQAGWSSGDDEIVTHYVEALWQAGQQRTATEAAQRWLANHSTDQGQHLRAVMQRLGIAEHETDN